MDLLWVLAAILALLVFFLYRRNYGYWDRKGVKGPTPMPLVGNIGNTILGRTTLGEEFAKIYFETRSQPFTGVYMTYRKTLVVNNLDLIRSILVKDFSHFTDHGRKFNDANDPLVAHLFNTTGEKWKNLRNKLTPTFTSSKIKYMFETVAQCGAEMSKFLDKTEGGVFDLKELLAKFNTDVIGSCAFGIECNSFTDPDAEFRKMGKKITQPSVIGSLIRLFAFFVPSLVSHLGISLLGKDINSFFTSTVENTIRYREQNNVVRNDFMQLLIRLKNDGHVADDLSGKGEAPADDGNRLTTLQIAAQVFVFFIAGFETSSTTASFALYELALNPELQDRLRAEIGDVLDRHGGKVTYEALGEMTYLTMVIEETLRKYPALPVIFRLCTKDYVIPGTDVTIERDTPVMIPILGIQRDPEHYPDPDRFDPERFTPERKASRHHFSYLPFGEGPRICIGSRFGMMQTRLGLVSVLSRYEVSVCGKTTVPMVYENKSFILTGYGGVWLKLTKRTSRL